MSRTETALVTILLVNDEKIVRTLVAVALRRQRYDVLEAATARRAVTLARNHRGAIDLLLTQLSIPGMNGLELARHLGTENPELRSLFLSISISSTPSFLKSSLGASYTPLYLPR